MVDEVLEIHNVDRDLIVHLYLRKTCCGLRLTIQFCPVKQKLTFGHVMVPKVIYLMRCSRHYKLCHIIYS